MNGPQMKKFWVFALQIDPWTINSWTWSMNEGVLGLYCSDTPMDMFHV